MTKVLYRALAVEFIAVILIGLAQLSHAEPNAAPDLAKIKAEAGKKLFQEICRQADRDRDARLSKVEFMAMYKDPVEAESKYKMWDLNSDGYITEQEYVSALQAIGAER